LQSLSPASDGRTPGHIFGHINGLSACNYRRGMLGPKHGPRWVQISTGANSYPWISWAFRRSIN
jgi:hypothetical protein